MSVKAMKGIWGRELTPTQSHVLLALADHADDAGCNAFPGVELIAWKTRLHQRTVRAALADLRKAGIIVPVSYARGGPGRATRYRLNPEAVPLAPKPSTPTLAQEQGSTLAQEQGSTLAVEPSTLAVEPSTLAVEHPNHQEPSVTVIEPSSPADAADTTLALIVESSSEMERGSGDPPVRDRGPAFLALEEEFGEATQPSTEGMYWKLISQALKGSGFDNDERGAEEVRRRILHMKVAHADNVRGQTVQNLFHKWDCWSVRRLPRDPKVLTRLMEEQAREEYRRARELEDDDGHGLVHADEILPRAVGDGA